MGRRGDFLFTLAVSIALYTLPDEVYSVLWRFTKYVLYGFGAGAASLYAIGYLKSKKKDVRVTWPEDWNASNTKVIRYEMAESSEITCKITRNGEIISSNLSWQNDELQVIFAAKQSGEYRISVQYDGWEVRNSPWVRYICPGPPDPEHCEVTGPWSTTGMSTIVIQPGYLTSSTLKLKDSYKNLVYTSRSDCNDVTLQVSNGSILVNSMETRVESMSSEIQMAVRFHWSGSFNITALYKGHKMCTINVIVCEPDQYSNLTNKSIQADLIELLGEEQSRPKNVHVYLNNKHITVKEYMMKVIPWTLLTHRVSPRLVLTLNSKCDTLLIINENLPGSRTILKGSNVLGLAAGYYTCLSKKLGGSHSLEEKKEHFSKSVREFHNSSYMQIVGNLDYIRNSKVYLKVDRQNIYESTLKGVKGLSRTDWLKLIVVRFEGEDGIDQGGLRREWMDLFSKFVFNPENKVFTPVEADGPGVQPNPYPPKNIRTDHYRLIGKLVGKCLFESCFGKTYRMNLHGQICKSLLTQTLGSDVMYTHLSVDAPQLYSSKIKYILDNDVEDLQLNFTQEEEVSPGTRKCVDLCSKGSHKMVTEDNKHEYIFRLAKFLLVERVSKQTTAFLEGFHSMIPSDVLEVFDESELELLLHGIREYNVEELKQNHVTVGFKTPSFRVVLDWFWMALSHFSKEDMAKFVQFVTGSSVLPPGGWQELSPKFQIGFSGETGRLPLSFTCSNYILLPNAANYQEFEKVLLMAVREGVDKFIMGS